MDEIIIKGLKVFANHGVLPEEKCTGQYFYIDMILYADLMGACESDDLEDTVNYDDVCNAAVEIMQSRSFDLIERAAQTVCDGILARFAKVKRIDLTVRKPCAPVKAEIEYAAVRIVRSK